MMTENFINFDRKYYNIKYIKEIGIADNYIIDGIRFDTNPYYIIVSDTFCNENNIDQYYGKRKIYYKQLGKDLHIYDTNPSNRFIKYYESLNSERKEENFIEFNRIYYNIKYIKEIGIADNYKIDNISFDTKPYYIVVRDTFSNKSNTNQNYGQYAKNYYKQLGKDLQIYDTNPSDRFIKYCNSLNSERKIENENQKFIDKITKKMDQIIDKIRNLEEKCFELDNHIKFLPIVSQEYQNAKEHFNQNS